MEYALTLLCCLLPLAGLFLLTMGTYMLGQFLKIVTGL